MDATRTDALMRADADEQAFAAWLRPHWHVMAALASRLGPSGEVEEVLQDALVAAWRFRARYDPQRGDARPWLLALVADHARRHRRRRARMPVVDRLSDEHPVAGTQYESNDELLAAVAVLPERQRIAVELHYFLDLPVDEVARVMKCRPGTVKSTLFSARKTLADTLSREEPTS